MFFARPRAKKNALVPPPKKRKASHAIEEIKFDPDARNEYLTGFHKRKVQRTKRAQEELAKRARQEKIDLRKQVREERKKEIEEHVQSVTAILKEAERAGFIDEEEDIPGDRDADEGGGEWGGFEDVPATAAADEPLDHEEEYIDEDRFTTVTVESVNVSRDGLIKPEEEKETDDDDESAKKNTETTPAGKDKNRVPKKKKPQFRYETKIERQHEQRKQTARKRKKAAARTA